MALCIVIPASYFCAEGKGSLFLAKCYGNLKKDKQQPKLKRSYLTEKRPLTSWDRPDFLPVMVFLVVFLRALTRVDSDMSQILLSGSLGLCFGESLGQFESLGGRCGKAVKLENSQT